MVTVRVVSVFENSIIMQDLFETESCSNQIYLQIFYSSIFSAFDGQAATVSLI